MTFKHTFKSGETGELHVNLDAELLDQVLDLNNQMVFLRQKHNHQELDIWFSEIMDWCDKNLTDYL